MVTMKKLQRDKLYVDLIGTDTRGLDMPKFNILLNLFSLNSLAQKFNIMHNI